MSMRDCPCRGFVVKAVDLIPALRIEYQNEAKELLEEAACDALHDLFTNGLPANLPFPQFPRVAEVFRLGDEDTPDEDMEIGELYVRFDEDELFTRKETPQMEALKVMGIEPKECSWSIYG